MFLNTGLTKLRLKLNSTNYFCKLGSRREREEKKRREKRRKRKRLANLKYLNLKKREVGGGSFLLEDKRFNEVLLNPSATISG